MGSYEFIAHAAFGRGLHVPFGIFGMERLLLRKKIRCKLSSPAHIDFGYDKVDSFSTFIRYHQCAEILDISGMMQVRKRMTSDILHEVPAQLHVGRGSTLDRYLDTSAKEEGPSGFKFGYVPTLAYLLMYLPKGK